MQFFFSLLHDILFAPVVISRMCAGSKKTKWFMAFQFVHLFTLAPVGVAMLIVTTAIRIISISVIELTQEIKIKHE